MVPFLIITPGLYIVMCRILNIEKPRFFSLFRTFFKFTGRNSLFIYLVSVAIAMVAPYVVSSEAVEMNIWIYNIAVIVTVYLITMIKNIYLSSFENLGRKVHC